MDPSASRLALIEETAMLQNDTPPEDFACHVYKTRHDRLKGVTMRTPEDVRQASKKQIERSMSGNVVTLRQQRDQGQDAMAWSMNWFRLRNNDNQIYTLTNEEKSLIVDDYLFLKDNYPITGEIHIFQLEGSEMLLVAVSLYLDTTPWVDYRAL
jgi:hypothetical protein